MHPLFDMDSQRRVREYRELAQNLIYWCREKTTLFQERTFPSTLIELKRMLNDLNRFRNEEVPPKQRDKQHLFTVYRELEVIFTMRLPQEKETNFCVKFQRYFESVGEIDVEPELRPESLEKAWHRLMQALADREHILSSDVNKTDNLQRLAEKLLREIKHTDIRITDIEHRIVEEARRIDRQHPIDAKNIVESIETEIRHLEAPLHEMDQDCRVLKEARYPQANDLGKK